MMVVMMMMMWFMVSFILLPSINCVTESKDPRENAEKKSWEQMLFYHRPTFKMIRRQVRNFRAGYVGTLTLVYRSSMPFDVRWFRHAPDLNLVNSEIPNKISVEGDPSYKLTTMKSGDVSSTKLSSIIAPNHKGEYAEFVTVFTSLDGSVQYQISTRVKIKNHGGTTVDNIDGPDWLFIPPRRSVLEEGRNLTLHCALLMARESRSFTDELSLLKEIKYSADPQFLSSDSRSILKFDFSNVVSIHKDTPNKVETQGESLLIGRRHKFWLLDSSEVIYELSLASPFSWSHHGRYMCIFDRSYDRLYHLNHVTVLPQVQTSGLEPLRASARAPDYPGRHRQTRYRSSTAGNLHPKSNGTLAVELVSCRSDNYATETLILFRGMPTCFRCRALGSDGLRLGLYRYGIELETYLAKKYQEEKRNFSIGKRNVLMENRDEGKAVDNGRMFHDDNHRSRRFGKTKRNVKGKTRRGQAKPGNDLALITNKHIRHRDEDDSRDLRGLSTFPLKDLWTSVAQVGISRFIHVADGGIHEVTFTFHRPLPSLLPPGEGYSCRGENEAVEKEVRFRIEYAP